MSNTTMSHEQALRSQAVERYVLGELTPEEREAFEGHYFDCTACFDQVKLSAQLLRHAGEVLDPEPEKGWLARMLGDLRRPVPAFVSAMLLCAIGMGTYQQFLIADLKAPRVEASSYLHDTQRGGAEKSISVPRKSRLSLTVDFNPTSDLTSYRAQILSQSGVKYTIPVAPGEVAAGKKEHSVTIGLLADGLDAGKYSVVVQGLGHDGVPAEVGSGSFDLQFAD